MKDDIIEIILNPLAQHIRMLYHLSMKKIIIAALTLLVFGGMFYILTTPRVEEKYEIMEEETYSGCEISVIVYMSPYCKYCTMAKKLLDDMGMPYEAVDVNESQTKRAEMIEKTQRKTVPQIYINDMHIGGYDDLKALYDAGKLKKFKKTCNTSDLK